jgi:hypothetical protein
MGAAAAGGPGGAAPAEGITAVFDHAANATPAAILRFMAHPLRALPKANIRPRDGTR